jgi:hypothetical protein
MKLSPNFSRSEFRCKGCTPDKPCLRDTPETQRQIVAHNAALAALCPTP